MKNILAQDFTPQDFESRVDALASALAKHFSFDTKKRNKLRDVTAAVMFGADSGFQQVKGLFYAPFKMPEPEKDYDLPDLLVLTTDVELEQVALYGCSNPIKDEQPDDLELLFQVSEYVTNMYEIPEVFEPEIYSKDAHGRTGECDLTKSSVLRYIAKHYEAIYYRIDVARIDKYGIGAGVHADEAVELIESFGISVEPMGDYPGEYVMIHDRGDDGGSEVCIELRRRAVEPAITDE